jgi:hypothetical protein
MSPAGDGRPLSWTIDEFGMWVASADNEAWDPVKDSVYQDMDLPLSHYWIATSHNTYAAVLIDLNELFLNSPNKPSAILNVCQSKIF